MTQKTPTDFDSRWKQVEELMKKDGLTRSAIEKVKEIQVLAKKENQPAHEIKALIYLSELMPDITDGEHVEIDSIQNEIKSAKTPVKQLLHSLLATRYYQLYEENRWDLFERTATSSFDEKDPETWSLADFHRVISSHYLASLEDENELKQTGLKDYSTILVKGNSENLRPTLYDLLAHQALDYFENDERDVPSPVNVFHVDDPVVFSPAEKFSKAKINTSDSTSLYFRALVLYQELLSFHLTDKDPSALLDADLARLEFARRVSIDPDKNQQYIKALELISATYPNHDHGALAKVKALMAKKEKADEFDKDLDSPNDQFALVELAKQFRQIESQFPGTEAAVLAQQQRLNITAQTISGQTEKVQVPGKPFLSLIQFRNVKQLYYRIISLDPENPLKQRNEKYWQDLVSQNSIRNVQVSLPDPGDHREHSVEIGIDALPVGSYAILASLSPEFTIADNALSVQFFHVSGIAYLKNGHDYYFMHRETGKPLENVKVDLVKYSFDYKASIYSYRHLKSLQSGKDGYAEIQLPSDYNENFLMDLRWGNDRLFSDESNYYYRYNSREQEPARIMGVVFTDRAIYRPGQPVFFKTILINKDKEGKKNSVVPGREVEIELLDANGEVVDTQLLRSNEFGSVKGEFRIPEGRLTGSYSIRIKDVEAYVSFRVEEYKRPTFNVEFSALKTEFRLGDSVTMQGKVQGYAGNILGDANVSYRVVRTVRLPWWYGYREFGHFGEEAEIAVGNTKSDENGVFTVTFKASPDPTIGKKNSPYFDFVVYADVTDVAGETRSGSKKVSMGYSSMELSTVLNDSKTYDSLSALKVNIKNLAGESLSTELKMELAVLESPNRLIRPRFWPVPDTAIMDYKEFTRKFPHDAYMNETDQRKWKIKSIWVNTTKTLKDGETISFNPLKPGWYKVILSGKDKYGDPVRSEQVFQVLDTKNWLNNDPAYTLAAPEKVKTEPGKSIRLAYGSAADSVTMIRTIIDGSGKSKSILVNSKPGITSLEVKPTENDRGGISINHAFIKHNRHFDINQLVDVPWTNKEIQVSTSTYRDKLLPGSKEKWTVRIQGEKADKMAAELLTSMYDASLDQFVLHNWYFPKLFRTAVTMSWDGNFGVGRNDSYNSLDNGERLTVKEKTYDSFLWNSFRTEIMYDRGKVMKESMIVSSIALDSSETPRKSLTGTVQSLKDEKESDQKPEPVTPRKNFVETAFFFPDLKTDAEGNVEFSFTMPESLTKWKWMSFAHTKDLATGMMIKEIVTQKELMVQPNMPRFLREADKIMLTARVSNLGDKAMTGEAELELIDPETNTSVDGLFKNIFPTQHFTANAKQTVAIQFEVEAPAQYSKPLQYRIIARAGNNSDGEEGVIPVLTNRILVTESLPLLMNGDGTSTFQFDKLLGNNSTTLSHYRLSVEYSTNPAWYAVLALPYLMEYPYECSEQTFSRLYANILASQITNSSPLIKTIFEKWRTSDTSALISNLMKNQELKQVLIEQTPWVLEAKSESQQRKNIAMLFETQKLSSELQKNLSKLSEMQTEDGAFPWFKGGPDSRYITQYIVTGIGRLNALGAVPKEIKQQLNTIASNALDYLDHEINSDYENLVRFKADLGKQQVSPLQIEYLYMRSFYTDSISQKNRKAFDYFLSQARMFWLKMDKRSQGIIALVLHRTGDKTLAGSIIKSLKENAIMNPTLGMYWKDNIRGYYWHQAPIETQSLLIEAFDLISNDKTSVEQMKLWLLNQKRVQDWESTKATADAVYALIRNGNNWLSSSPQAQIRVGNTELTADGQEAGTGYFKKVIDGPKVKNEMGKISVSVKGTSNTGISWGAVHWQYFEDMNKVSSSSTPVKLAKQFYIERKTAGGPILEELKEGQNLHVGDKLTVRIILKADRDMEFMHMRDLRASGTEPVNVLSNYKWRGGLGYYESTRDASTDFFFDLLPKGSWVFEYPLFVTHSGQFTAGICSIQSMYAPEFNAHSEGRKISSGARE